uniref:A kinase (PRKA) anchor protein 10 n=1 Tax=Scophthalmus maximus TaxID=52904 RepID=A0A8D3CGT8_SCOMX
LPTAKSKEPERVTDAKVNRAPVSPHSPSLGLRNHHAIQEAAGPSHVAINAISANMDSFARGRTAILKKQPSHMEAAHFGDLGHSSVNYQPQETRSRLSKTVDQVLRDNVAIPHYMHFMELQGADHLVRFWLEAESFRSSSWSRIRAHSLNSVKQSSLAEPVPASPGGSALPVTFPHTPNALSRDSSSEDAWVPPQWQDSSSSTEAGLRPGTPQADTPSRQTPSSTGTPYKLQSNSTLRELSDKLMKSIEKDAITIFTKYISPDAVRPIPITEQFRNDIVAKICGEDGMVDPNCFVIAQSLVLAILEQQHFIEFLRSHHFCKYQIEVLTSGSVFLADILFCESALFYFSEFLVKYFSLQATNPLGFGDSVRMEIESNICREGGPLPDCFTTPLRQAWTTMEKVYMPGFLSSNLYYKYLSDLINSVRADEFVNVSTPGQSGPADNDRSSSNASEGSQTQQSARKAAIKILKNFDEAITVDVASLDPESLYQRPYAGKMTFGKVNEMGQFIREAEPEPDVKKSKGSMFSQAMKKWVQGNSDEAQEEMAWQIAKMIVNDVVHQSGHDSPGKATKVQTLTQVSSLLCG